MTRSARRSARCTRARSRSCRASGSRRCPQYPPARRTRSTRRPRRRERRCTSRPRRSPCRARSRPRLPQVAPPLTQPAPPLTQPAPPLSQPAPQPQPVPPPPIATVPQPAPTPQPTHSAGRNERPGRGRHRGAETLLSVRQASWRPGARGCRRSRRHGMPARRHAAGPRGGAPVRGRAPEARARIGRGVRFAPAHRLRGGLGRGDADARGPRRQYRSRASRRGHPRVLGPARERRRGADHPPDQRAADAGRQGERLGYPHRALREPAGDPLPRRRRAARGAADQARRRAARGLAHQGHVQARYRRAAAAPGRPHLAAHRGPRGGRARLDPALGPWRARGAALARQASRPHRAHLARDGSATPRQPMDEIIHKPHGIILVTGPTGSGKIDHARMPRSSASTTTRAIS